MTHRRIEGHDVYFLINDSSKTWHGLVDFAATGQVEQWDPASGKAISLSQQRPITLSLEPYGATFVRFSTPPPSSRHPLKIRPAAGPADKALAARAAHDLPRRVRHRGAAPRPVAGSPRRDPIRGQCQADQGEGGHSPVREIPLRQAHQPGATSIAWSSTRWIPAGQKTRNEILLILHEEGGGDFIASSGRSLGLPGHERSFVPLDQFQHAGWSHDADGVLDLTRITGVSIGWGGYLGVEGEQVRFQVASPRLGLIAPGQTVAK